MKITGNTILITGGATGIGFSLAGLLSEHDNEVIICGRREGRLREAQADFPGLKIKVCDVSKAEERQSLYDWLAATFPGVNVLVNNAGIQRMLDFRKGTEDFSAGESEIDTNLAAPVHLAALFTPLFCRGTRLSSTSLPAWPSIPYLTCRFIARPKRPYMPSAWL